MSENMFTNAYSATVSDILKTQLSNYAVPPDSLLGGISMLPITYGKEHIIRPVADPTKTVTIGRGFDAPDDPAEKVVQSLDTFSLSDRLAISRHELASDPSNAQLHVAAHGNIFRNGIEKFFMEGDSEGKHTIRSLIDHPNAVVGVANRPEVAGWLTTAGAWKTAGNIESDMIAALSDLVADGFYGPYALLAPSIVRPMLLKFIQYTDFGTEAWIKRGKIDILFSPFVHEAAAKTDFDVYMIDRTKVHIGLSEVQMDAFYSQQNHKYYWDWEVWGVPLFDPLNNETEWVKGVVGITGCAW